MRKFIIAIICILGTAGAYAENENAATSKEYVDTELATKQPTIPAAGNNVVMTFDSNATDGIGTKNIYDPSDSYMNQQNALVTAGTANTAVQMAINGEFECVLYDPDNTTDCWWWNIKQPTRLPAGYTELEYIESDGICYFNTSIAWENVSMFRGKAQATKILDNLNRAVLGGSSRDDVSAFYGFWYTTATGYAQWYWNTNIPPTTTAEFNISYIGNQYIGTINGTSTASNQSKFDGTVQIMNTRSSNNRYFTGRVWYIQLFDSNGAMIFNGIPARNTNNTVGIYDTVSGTFLTNAGSGNCIAGPVVSFLPQNQQ